MRQKYANRGILISYISFNTPTVSNQVACDTCRQYLQVFNYVFYQFILEKQRPHKFSQNRIQEILCQVYWLCMHCLFHFGYLCFCIVILSPHMPQHAVAVENLFQDANQFVTISLAHSPNLIFDEASTIFQCGSLKMTHPYFCSAGNLQYSTYRTTSQPAIRGNMGSFDLKRSTYLR